MNKPLIISAVISAISAGTTFAATIELMPDLPLNGTTPTSSIYNSNGRLSGSGITAADVSGWLGGKSDGWYFTTGNGVISPAGAIVVDGVMNYQSVALWGGISTGTVMTVDFSDYTSLTLSGSALSQNADVSGVWSAWYETQDGDVVLLSQGDITYTDGQSWTDFSYTIEGAQYQEMASSGNGRVYFIVGYSNSGASFAYGQLKNASLKGDAVIPEPATTTLGLLGLAALASRRRKTA